MKLLNKAICITSIKSLTILFTIAICLCFLAFIADTETPKPVAKCSEEIWIPTEDDIAYQDTMYAIIQSTQNDITNIKEDIVYIIERLDYDDGTHDSIRYVKGGEIDLRRN